MALRISSTSLDAANNDYTQATSNLSLNTIQQQAATRALALYNANQANVLNLINPTKG